MNITFINKSDKAVHITLPGESLISETISVGESKALPCNTGTFTLQVDEGSHVTYILAKFGVVLRRHFKVKSEYSANSTDDLTVTLRNEKKKGRFMDEYERVVPSSVQDSLSLLSYSVPDEAKLKKELSNANKRADNTIKIFDVFDILGNALSALLFLLIPFVIIWIFADIELAGKICGMAFIPIFGLIIYFNRFFDKLRRSLWKTAKNKRLEKDIFKDYNSYFDNDYISSVLGR